MRSKCSYVFVVSGEELECVSEDGRGGGEVAAGDDVSRDEMSERVQLNVFHFQALKGLLGTPHGTWKFATFLRNSSS